ncbi:MAG: hypothetical protein IJ228_14200 [Succinivibrio sp.]|nr:hypothetical protein [Succinivibrio sp.]
MRKLTAAAALSLTVLTSACTSVVTQDQVSTLDNVENRISKGVTTGDEVRAYLGTPNYLGTASDGKNIMGFALNNSRKLDEVGKSFLKGFVTFGIASSSIPEVVKAIVFKLDDKGVVEDYAAAGYTYIQKKRVTFWLEADREMTERELHSEIDYDEDEIYELFWQDLAKAKGVSVSDLSSDEKYQEFKFCNIPCHAARIATKAYGPLKTFTFDVQEKAGDGSRMQEMFGSR